MKYPAYPKYKYSGVEWLGEVPEHWEVKRLKNIAASFKAGPFGSSLTKDMYSVSGYRVYGQEQVIPGDFSVGDYYIPEEAFVELKQYRVSPGDVLVSCVGTFGKIAVVPDDIEPGIINPRLIRIATRDTVDPVYLATILRSSFVYEQFSLYSRGGTMDIINIGILSEIILPVPPQDEQAIIESHVQSETSKLDTLIAKKRELIDKLKEKRAALITRTVTRGLPPDAATAAGLDPHPKMKDSGVEWLGEVPEHWEVKRLKHYIQHLNSGASVNSDNMPTEDDFPGILKTSCVYGDVFRPEENKRVVEEEINRIFCPVLGDSLIISRMNTPELVGSCGYVAQDWTNLYLPDRLWITKFANKKISFPKFFWYRIISRDIKEQISSLATGTSGSMKNLMQESFLSIAVAIPPLSEQRATAAYLDRETAAIDALVAKVETAIDRLQEYRAALITAAVTGQIDVREAVQ